MNLTKECGLKEYVCLWDRLQIAQLWSMSTYFGQIGMIIDMVTT